MAAVDPLTSESGLFTVSQINQAVGSALAEAFPASFWVVGEIQGFERDAAKAGTRRWGQVYFELVEKEEGADAVRASTKAMMWGDALGRVAKRLKETGGDLRLTDGLKVKFLCKMDFYWPRASLQLKVLDLDPDFTLGDMEKARRELVDRLKREGLFDANRARPLPIAPRVVGLVTSDGSAAYHDFVNELQTSGIGFNVVFADARMQGEETEPSVLRALKALEADESVEVIALVRGGGSRSDLMWFDREKIALAVARCSKPVLTGIGHEIDLSVADLVAHASQKTPTACAGYLIERVRTFEADVKDATSRITAAARERAAEASRSLAESIRNWKNLASLRISEAVSDISSAGEALVSGVRRHLAVRRERLVAAAPRLVRAGSARFGSWRDRLDGIDRELALKDPRRLLARGYGLIFAGGRLVKSVASVAAGTVVEAQVSDGRFESVVSKVERGAP